MTKMTQDVEYDVSLTLGDAAYQYDIEGIAAEIQREYATRNIDIIPSEEYWDIVKRHIKPEYSD